MSQVLSSTIQSNCIIDVHPPAVIIWSRTIAETPRLARLVHSLLFPYVIPLSLAQTAAAAFRTMVNLKELMIINNGTKIGLVRLQPWMLDVCIFRLHKYINQLGTFKWDASAKFLSEQSEISHLISEDPLILLPQLPSWLTLPSHKSTTGTF